MSGTDSNKGVTPARQRSNLMIAGACAAFFAGMLGMAYASVPLYRLFCQITGYGGTTQRVETYADRVLDRTITIRFDANTAGALPWEFQPSAREITGRIGETMKATYRAVNRFNVPTYGRATFNVTPEMAGAYFNKIECFCFTDTTLAPGESLDMPVVFYVDPDIVDVPELKDIRTITLSYTFFPIEGAKPVASASDGGDNNTAKQADGKLGG
ncbi:MAG TPA: cytochrome c oxidase assembly protein [Rhizobiales bacterium]|nr:cytochrome c oxidase assembly protein [Hyphomicrobiales bacterium]